MSSSPLFDEGRERLRDLLLADLDDNATGASCIVFGAHGSGKTLLVRSALAEFLGDPAKSPSHPSSIPKKRPRKSITIPKKRKKPATLEASAADGCAQTSRHVVHFPGKLMRTPLCADPSRALVSELRRIFPADSSDSLHACLHGNVVGNVRLVIVVEDVELLLRDQLELFYTLFEAAWHLPLVVVGTTCSLVQLGH